MSQKTKTCYKCHYQNDFKLRSCKKCNAHLHKRKVPNYNPYKDISIEKKREILKPLLIDN